MSCTPLVTIEYSDLINFSDDDQNVMDKIASAFGREEHLPMWNNTTTATTSSSYCSASVVRQSISPPLGILAVTNVPTLQEKRQCLLPMARQMALLQNKDGITCPESNYQTGWSHGKEMFDGKPDLSKGSFYANPLLVEDRDSTWRTSSFSDDKNTLHDMSPKESSPHQQQQQQDIPRDIVQNNPGFFAPNVWPTHPSMLDFQNAFIDLATLVMAVGRLVARPCDAHIARHCVGYKKHKLTRLLHESKFCKARLLHYFAQHDNERSGREDRTSTTVETNDDNDKGNHADDFSDWCGWHNDHGSLTGLVPAMYLDANGKEISTDSTCHNGSGLYIQARDGSIHHVVLPANSIGFQIGETSQIHSGGILQATPHAVRRGRADNNKNENLMITRESFAVFMEPEYFGDMDLPEGMSVEDVQDASIALPSSVKTLSSRWKPGMNFGEFSNATFSAFY